MDLKATLINEIIALKDENYNNPYYDVFAVALKYFQKHLFRFYFGSIILKSVP